jgi:hypothetical protein
MHTLLLSLLLLVETYPPPKSLGPVETYGKNIQRTMRLLATSTREQSHRVTILFYGQSITEQNWWKDVTADLRKRYPYALLRVENRAVGGFSSQVLVKLLESDVAALQPDLIIFHVYGSHLEYENIFKWIRTHTTAEILQQTDHATKPEDLTEEMNPSELTMKQWSPWMNHNFLPGMSKKYQTELVNQHELWKQYLRDHQLQPKQLLRDAVHLNDHGCYLMAELAKAYLRYDPKLGPSPTEEWTKVTKIEPAMWKGKTLELEWSGRHLDLWCGQQPVKVKVKVDGQPLKDIAPWMIPTRTTSYPGSKWPCLLRAGFEKPRVEEEWTIKLKEIDEKYEKINFTLKGSVTGEDGEGVSNAKFTSKSGRVVIEKDDWNFGYASKVFGKKLKPGFEIKWRVLPYYQLRELGVMPRFDKDILELPVVSERSHTLPYQRISLASGLKNTKHRLELTIMEGDTSSILGLQIYQPPLGRE